MSDHRKSVTFGVFVIVILLVAALASMLNPETAGDDDLITAAMAHGPTENCLFGTEPKYLARPCYMTIAMGPQFILLGPGAENAYRVCMRDPYIRSEFLAETSVCKGKYKERVRVCYQSRADEILYLDGKCVPV